MDVTDMENADPANWAMHYFKVLIMSISKALFFWYLELVENSYTFNSCSINKKIISVAIKLAFFFCQGYIMHDVELFFLKLIFNQYINCFPLGLQ